MVHRLRAIPHDRMHLSLMLVLTFGTGIIDAVGYLGLDRVFTGNMTGNVVILGMAVTGADDLPLLGPVLALVGFMAGAALGGRVLKSAAGAWTRRTTLLFGSVALIEFALAGALIGAGERTPHGLALATTGLLGVAMGIQGATARFIAVKEVTTVVVTSTILGLAADSVFGSGKSGSSGRRLLAVSLIIAGAAAGAVLLRWHLAAGLIVAGVLALGCTLAGAVHAGPRTAAPR
ncbi:YoaK family protein [Nocardioides sp. R-C-SC26]|uniref:YoaK family protein n=1 Tax=Nocardioides sp. R-C-SC26 TaxID=2870414 RepID=UPI001E4DF8B6|nr:YoaK family protein [Nocardioides sp. R-C-SC26]